MCSGIEGDGDVDEGNLIYWRGSSHGTIFVSPLSKQSSYVAVALPRARGGSEFVKPSATPCSQMP
jgi:hypothetical protein